MIDVLMEHTLPESNIPLMEELLHQSMGLISQYLQASIHPRWLLFGISEPSTVAPETMGVYKMSFLLGPGLLTGASVTCWEIWECRPCRPHVECIP